jgi:MSHA biogenesis protein MshK
MRVGLLHSLLLAAMLATTGGARSQELIDPTRPPSARIGALDVPEETTGTQLQGILFSSGRKVAVINGAMVPLGGMVGEAKLVRISETQVVLRKGDETEVLKLFPSVEKRPAKRRSGSGSAGRVSTRQGGSK